jgi:hypothetical protein
MGPFFLKKKMYSIDIVFEETCNLVMYSSGETCGTEQKASQATLLWGEILH